MWLWTDFKNFSSPELSAKSVFIVQLNPKLAFISPMQHNVLDNWLSGIHCCWLMGCIDIHLPLISCFVFGSFGWLLPLHQANSKSPFSDNLLLVKICRQPISFHLLGSLICSQVSFLMLYNYKQRGKKHEAYLFMTESSTVNAVWMEHLSPFSMQRWQIWKRAVPAHR